MLGGLGAIDATIGVVNDLHAIHILGFAGSLRSGSYNRALLRAAVRAAPAGAVIETFDLADIPLYDADLQASGDPEAVRLLKQRVRDADALLIVTPEYNNAMSGVLKNAIDWVSRPPAGSPLEGKPVGIVGATDGPWGTVRAQQNLRLVLAATGAIVMVRPTVFVPRAAELVGGSGEFEDQETLRRVEGFMAALVAWARRFQPIAEATPR
jgi:chromate reductase